MHTGIWIKDADSHFKDLLSTLVKLINMFCCVQMDSRMHVDNLEKVLLAATQGCHDVFGVLNRTVREHVEQHVGILDMRDS